MQLDARQLNYNCQGQLPGFTKIDICMYDIVYYKCTKLKFIYHVRRSLWHHVGCELGGSAFVPAELWLILCENSPIFLPWQHKIGLPGKPPVWCELGNSSICTSRDMADLM